MSARVFGHRVEGRELARTAPAGADKFGRGVAGLLRQAPTWVLWLVVAVWMLPTVGLLITSVRSPGFTQTSGWWASLFSAETWTLDGYRAAFNASANNSFVEGMLNSVTISLVATAVPVLLASWAAYAFVWIPFRGRSGLFLGIVGLLAVPVFGVLIPLLQAYVGGVKYTLPMLEKTVTLFPVLGLAGSIEGVWVTHVGTQLPFAIFLLTFAFARMPPTLVDMARVDGASHLQAYWKVILPLAKPALAALTALLFLYAWNDFLIALTVIGASDPSLLPATVKLASIGVFVDGPSVAAGTFVHSAVAILVFVVFQRYYIRGLLATVDS